MNDTRTIEEIMQECNAIISDTTLTEQQKRQALNILQRETFCTFGVYSEQFCQIESFILRAKLKRSA